MTEQERLKSLHDLEMNDIAARAAKAASKEVFAHLGVNVEDAQQVEEFRKDLRFGGAMRKIADRSFVGIITTGFAVIAIAAWVGITGFFGGDR